MWGLGVKLEQPREAEGSAGLGLPEPLQEQQGLQATVQAALAESGAVGESHLYTHTRWHSGKQQYLRYYRCWNRACPQRAVC